MTVDDKVSAYMEQTKSLTLQVITTLSPVAMLSL